jgi:hypothetical protein
VRIPCIGKYALQPTSADGLNTKVSEYTTSALTMQHGICDIAREWFDCAAEIAPRSDISWNFYAAGS